MNLLVGNGISLVAALFLAASCCVKERRRVFLLQTANCLLLAAASWFFGSYAGITTLLVSAARNYVVAKGKYTKPVMAGFLALTVILGIWVNNRGWIGLLPVAATVQYTLCCHFFTSVKGTRGSIWVNELLWVFYSCLILNFATAFSDLAVLLVDSVSLFWNGSLKRK